MRSFAINKQIKAERNFASDEVDIANLEIFAARDERNKVGAPSKVIQEKEH